MLPVAISCKNFRVILSERSESKDPYYALQETDSSHTLGMTRGCDNDYNLSQSDTIIFNFQFLILN